MDPVEQWITLSRTNPAQFERDLKMLPPGVQQAVRAAVSGAADTSSLMTQTEPALGAAPPVDVPATRGFPPAPTGAGQFFDPVSDPFDLGVPGLEPFPEYLRPKPDDTVQDEARKATAWRLYQVLAQAVKISAGAFDAFGVSGQGEKDEGIRAARKAFEDAQEEVVKGLPGSTDAASGLKLIGDENSETWTFWGTNPDGTPRIITINNPVPPTTTAEAPSVFNAPPTHQFIVTIGSDGKISFTENKNWVKPKEDDPEVAAADLAAVKALTQSRLSTAGAADASAAVSREELEQKQEERRVADELRAAVMAAQTPAEIQEILGTELAASDPKAMLQLIEERAARALRERKAEMTAAKDLQTARSNRESNLESARSGLDTAVTAFNREGLATPGQTGDLRRRRENVQRLSQPIPEVEVAAMLGLPIDHPKVRTVVAGYQLSFGQAPQQQQPSLMAPQPGSIPFKQPSKQLLAPTG